MPIRYILKQLILPPGGLLLLILLAWWLRNRAPRLALLCFVLGFGGLWAMSLPVTVQWAGRLIETEPALPEPEWPELSERAGAIVVLGAGREQNDPAWSGDQPSHIALERLRYAARIAKASELPLLLSGGLHYGQPPSEAQLGAEVMARDFGVTVHWLEERSRTTWENAVYSAEILREAGVERVVLVTSAAHMPRSRWCFEQQGLEVIAAPAGFLGVEGSRPLGGWLPEAQSFHKNGQLLNEAAGQLLYPLAYP